MQKLTLPRALWQARRHPTHVSARRTYATPTTTSPVPSPLSDPARVYTPRKTHLHAEYTSLISNSPVLLILRHANFSVAQLTKLRRDVAAVAKGKDKDPSSGPAPSLSVVRPALFGASLRSSPTVNQHVLDDLSSMLNGPVAMLSLPTLHPPHISALLRVLDRAAPQPRPGAKPDEAGAALPSLTLLGALVEGNVLTVQRVREVSKLPSLDTLRAQIVGLISAPAMQLASTLQSASGGSLARTLEGFKKGLEEAESGPSSS